MKNTLSVKREVVECCLESASSLRVQPLENEGKEAIGERWKDNRSVLNEAFWFIELWYINGYVILIPIYMLSEKRVRQIVKVNCDVKWSNLF